MKPSFPGTRRLMQVEPPPSRFTTSSQPMLSISSASSVSVAPALMPERPSMT